MAWELHYFIRLYFSNLIISLESFFNNWYHCHCFVCASLLAQTKSFSFACGWKFYDISSSNKPFLFQSTLTGSWRACWSGSTSGRARPRKHRTGKKSKNVLPRIIYFLPGPCWNIELLTMFARFLTQQLPIFNWYFKKASLEKVVTKNT